jgi:hypothetical protein
MLIVLPADALALRSSERELGKSRIRRRRVDPRICPERVDSSVDVPARRSRCPGRRAGDLYAGSMDDVHEGPRGMARSRRSAESCQLHCGSNSELRMASRSLDRRDDGNLISGRVLSTRRRRRIERKDREGRETREVDDGNAKKATHARTQKRGNRRPSPFIES